MITNVAFGKSLGFEFKYGELSVNEMTALVNSVENSLLSRTVIVSSVYSRSLRYSIAPPADDFSLRSARMKYICHQFDDIHCIDMRAGVLVSHFPT